MGPSFQIPASSGAGQPLARRWAPLARAVALAPETPVVVALSGGADSVLLLHLVASAAAEDARLGRASRARQPGAPARVTAVHVEHGLRGAEGELDAAFCERVCADLGVPLVRRRIALDPAQPSLEARAREQRYRALCEEAQRAGVRTILTGHHADDALETLLQRWLRGTDLHGLAGLRPRLDLAAPRTGRGPSVRERLDALNATGIDLEVVRPLIAMRREEVRRILSDHGLAWREDGSNASARFTRNRIRNQLLPGIESVCGPDAVENLRAFGAAVETLEERCAALTVPLAWMPPLHAAACRGGAEADLGGTIARASLQSLVTPLRRRALWRLLTEGTGQAPSRTVLGTILDDLEAGRCTRHSLSGGWSLHLRSDLCHLEPPLVRERPHADALDDGQLDLPFDRRPGARGEGLRLEPAGIAALPDGRWLTAELVELGPATDVLRSALAVELDARDLALPLHVRFARPGDRFHGLGAPGSRRIGRFLADAGVPSRDRAHVPLVLSGAEIIWVAGLRPCERRRVRATTEQRLRLALHHPAPIDSTASGTRDATRADERASLFSAR